MTRRSHGRTGSANLRPPITQVLDPVRSYERSMSLIRARLISIEALPLGEAPLLRAERIALQVRKIVEGVAFAALSAVEHRNKNILSEQRTKDADKLLSWLDHRQLLRLPSGQTLEASPSVEFKCVFSGAANQDMKLEELKSAYSRASSLIHERHPERLTDEQILIEGALIEEDARRLRGWLWLHIMFLRGEGFLVQMGQHGTPSFFGSIMRVGDLPTTP